VAQAAITHLLAAVTADFESAHGRIEGGSFAVVALGKLGSAEMTATSDLDLIFVYDCALTTPSGGDVKSDGARPLHATTYYTRLGQRLVNAITSPTEEGKLYEVDLRLRPSGNKGPLATRLAGFESYHAESAWTWERMALTRARVIAGPDDLKARIEAVIEHTLTAPRDARATRADIRDMRRRLVREFGTRNPWDVKYVRGGLVDLEFIAQGLQLLHGVDHPELLTPSTAEALARAAGAGALDPEEGLFLGEALELTQTIDHILRLALEGGFEPEAAPEALKRLLARACGTEFEELAARLSETEAHVLRTFESVFGSEGGA
jgi:glutamate-ammonia-ligase adenylyltransferase